MNKIVAKEYFSEKVVKFVVEAPLIAKARKAGHFVIVRVGEKGERIPLTIAAADVKAGTITLVVQAVGKSSSKLCALNPGDYITDVVGPLGRATHIEKFGTVVCCGGGVGCAPLLPIVAAMKEAGNRVITVLAARTKELIILEKQMREYSDEVIIMTDDGSSCDTRCRGCHQSGEGRPVCDHRAGGDDEVCFSIDSKVRYTHGCISEYDYGRWNRHVWSMSDYGGRKNSFRMYRRAGV